MPRPKRLEWVHKNLNLSIKTIETMAEMMEIDGLRFEYEAFDRMAAYYQKNVLDKRRKHEKRKDNPGCKG